jgi:hypothetical protein
MTAPANSPTHSPTRSPTRSPTAWKFEGAAAAAFTPLSLFAAGEKGVWYDPSDLTSMFQNSNGTTAVAVGDPVGYIADKSGNGKHAIQATAGARPVLRQDANSKYYLDFDGTDDFLSAASVALTTTDAVSIWGGAKSDDLAGATVITEFSADVSANNGAFFVVTESFTGYRFRVKGTVESADRYCSNGTGEPFTFFCNADISADSFDITLNNVAGDNTASDMGTGNFGTYTLYLGARSGPAIPLNGRVYGLVILNRSPVSTEKADGETWMNGKTAAY